MSYKIPTATDLHNKLLDNIKLRLDIENTLIDLRAVEYLDTGTEESRANAKKHQVRKDVFIEVVKAIKDVYDDLEAEAHN